MEKRSGAGNYYQIPPHRRRFKHNKSCAWKLQHPHYVHLALDACVPEIELKPLCPSPMPPLLLNAPETSLSSLCVGRATLRYTLSKRIVPNCMISDGGCGPTNQTIEGSCLGSHPIRENRESTSKVHQDYCGSCDTCCSRSLTTGP